MQKDSSAKTEGWFPIARSVVELIPTIGHSAFSVLMVIANHADSSGRCWPSMERLVKKSGLKRRAVQKALETLSGHKLITVRSQFGPRGQRTNSFALCQSAFPVRGRTQMRSPHAPECAGGAHLGAHRTTPSVNDNHGERQIDLGFVDSEKWEEMFLKLVAMLPRGVPITHQSFIGQIAWLLCSGVDFWDQVRSAFTASKEVDNVRDPVNYIWETLANDVGRETLASYLRMAPKPEDCSLPIPEPYERIA